MHVREKLNLDAYAEPLTAFRDRLVGTAGLDAVFVVAEVTLLDDEDVLEVLVRPQQQSAAGFVCFTHSAAQISILRRLKDRVPLEVGPASDLLLQLGADDIDLLTQILSLLVIQWLRKALGQNRLRG